METGALGKVYQRGEAIVRQGEAADCLYVIQSGQAEMVQDKDGREVRLALLGEQDFLGETAILENGIRSATVRAVSEVRAITVDKKTFLHRIHEDPSLVFRVLQKMSHRIRKLSTELVRIKGGGEMMDNVTAIDHEIARFRSKTPQRLPRGRYWRRAGGRFF